MTAGVTPSVLTMGLLDVVLRGGLTVNEFNALDGTPGVATPPVVTGFTTDGGSGAVISVLHSRIVNKVASSTCGSIMI